MTDETATSSAAEAPNPGTDEWVNAPEVADVQPDESAPEASDDDLDEEAAPVEDDAEEVDIEGVKYKIPAALKDHFLRQADYTRKTQEVAETRKSLEAQAAQLAQREQFHSEFITDAAEVTALDKALAQYKDVDWQALRSQDRDAAEDHWFNFQQLQQTRAEAMGRFQAKAGQRLTEQQHETAKRLAEGSAILARDIKDWSPAKAEELVQYGVKEFGFSEAELRGITDPRVVKAIHRLAENDKAAKKTNTAQVLAQSQAVQPAAKVTGTAQANTRRTTDASGDKLSTEEWARREAERVAARRKAMRGG